ncbi:hypothetical protein COCMIDRAFT_25872 [Bipolaris oryzae ATCC 44560]|uniref:Uncharacterized protein n=1 Tax=Bipolaris oryzae ATCC 44560 TaxID=930090 RepID=W6Z2L0_COCMI|nr:uncharacterized protein COCMIDRAFT_25872 [Bipolaris oryzae ATCC 44560]EUC45992.1 hypothetical protein COCMIDRAFT_25872 [Bipolaris oryzae ATCC 44560]
MASLALIRSLRLTLPRHTAARFTIVTNNHRHSQRCSLSTRATFHYLEDRPEYQTVKPYHINIPERAFDPGLQSNEVSIAYHDIPVTGLRNRIGDFTLDRNGFKVVIEDEDRGGEMLCRALPYEEYADEASVRDRARKAVEEFLKRNIDGCEDAVAFSHQVRRRDRLFPMLPRGTSGAVPQPVQGVHVVCGALLDMTPDGSHSEVQDALAARGYTDMSKRRWAVVHIWRPLFGPLQDWPLALMDYTSLDKARDLISSDNIYVHRIRENYNVLWNKRHKWYFLEDQQPNEILVFKTFDTHATKGHARLCAHASFRNPLAAPTARPRESFECLSVVIFPEGSAASNSFEEPLPAETPPGLLGEKLAEMKGGLD